MIGLLGFLMHVWIILGFYLYAIYYSVVVSTMSQAWKKSQPVVLMQYEEYMGSASLCCSNRC